MREGKKLKKKRDTGTTWKTKNMLAVENRRYGNDSVINFRQSFEARSSGLSGQPDNP